MASPVTLRPYDPPRLRARDYGLRATNTASQNFTALEALISTVVEVGATTVDFDAGVYPLDDVLFLDSLANVRFVGHGTTFKMADNFSNSYDGSSPHLFVFQDCEDIHFEGVTFDGNKANNPGTTLINTIEDSQVSFNRCVWKNCGYHAMWIRYSSQVSVWNSSFLNNCLPTGTNSDVFTSGTCKFIFENCKFIRVREEGPMSAFYISSGNGTYINNHFEGPLIAYDLRTGEHTILGGSGTVDSALYTQIGDQSGDLIGDVRVFANGMRFNITSSDSFLAVNGCYFVRGKVDMRNCKFTKVGGDSERGLRISTQEPCIVENCTFDGWDLVGIFIRESAGGHQINNNYINGNGTGRGIYSLNNTGPSFYKGNTITDFAVPVDNNDSMLFANDGIPIGADSTAPNNFLYYSTTQSALTYKNASGDVFTIDATAPA